MKVDVSEPNPGILVVSLMILVTHSRKSNYVSKCTIDCLTTAIVR